MNPDPTLSEALLEAFTRGRPLRYFTIRTNGGMTLTNNATDEPGPVLDAMRALWRTYERATVGACSNWRIASMTEQKGKI